MKQMLEEYGVPQSLMILYCEDMSAISIYIWIGCEDMSAITHNPVQHSRTKHIDIRHHFISELVEDNIISLEHVRSSVQLVDIFTKPLDASTFERLWVGVGVCQQPA